MTWKLRKNRDQLSGEARLYVDSQRRYFSVYIWETTAALQEATPDNALPVPSEFGRDGGGDVLGCVCHSPVRLRIESDGAETRIIRPKLGEIHLVSGRWTTEIVAHECLHASIGAARHIGPDLANMEDEDGAEETLCYRHGEMVDSLYRWLWENDAPRRDPVAAQGKGGRGS